MFPKEVGECGLRADPEAPRRPSLRQWASSWGLRTWAHVLRAQTGTPCWQEPWLTLTNSLNVWMGDQKGRDTGRVTSVRDRRSAAARIRARGWRSC